LHEASVDQKYIDAGFGVAGQWFVQCEWSGIPILCKEVFCYE
jgi:hypothetical protein